MTKLVILTDLDGCLLNKQDYDYSAALPTLDRLARIEIPLVLCSSKTEAEMTPLANTLHLGATPITCENGGVVVWRNADGSTARQDVLGASRTQILDLLDSLRPTYQFRSFRDLDVEGIMQMTSLNREDATAANDRHCTEPLLWDDAPGAIDSFRKAIEDTGLTFTKGGRFWHVAGQTTKGAAMRRVLDRFESNSGQPVKSIAIGDSPIDQSMLNIADYPIGIPAPDGSVNVTVNDAGIIAEKPGAIGWAESVGKVLDRLGFPN